MTITVGELEVRGGATPEEVAAVLAVVSQRDRSDQRHSRYELWRAGRVAALRATTTGASATLDR